MAFIKTIPAADAVSDVRAMYARQQDAWGYVPNYAKVFCHRPQVMARWGRLLAEIRRPMDARRFELVTFAAAHALRHSGCTLAHGQALTAFFNADEIVALVSDKPVTTLTDAEKVMMHFARKVVTDASRITAGDVAALSAQGFGDDEIFDIAATAAGRAFFTKLLDGLGVEPEASMQTMDETLRRRLTVGRPIDFKAPEVMPEAG